MKIYQINEEHIIQAPATFGQTSFKLNETKEVQKIQDNCGLLVETVNGTFVYH